MKHPSRRMSHADHEALRLSGKTVSTEAVSLRFGLKNKAISDDSAPLSPTQYAFVVSGKVAPRAVDRNRLKRRGRAILKRLEPRLIPGYQCAFFLKKPALSADFAKLALDIEKLLISGRLIS